MKSHTPSVSARGLVVRPTSLTHSGIARKAIVALTGLLLAGWMLLHAAGSLGVFAGPKVMNEYAALLRATGLLWVMRAGLALAVLAHAWLALGLTQEARHARPRDYRRLPLRQSAKPGRWMRSSGLLLAAWLVYHVAHMYGPAHYAYVSGDVHHNLVTGLASPPVALSYAVATLLLGVHLHHGVRSTLSTLGTPARLRQRGELPSLVFSIGITLVLLAPPVAALGGYWRQ